MPVFAATASTGTFVSANAKRRYPAVIPDCFVIPAHAGIQSHKCGRSWLWILGRAQDDGVRKEHRMIFNRRGNGRGRVQVLDATDINSDIVAKGSRSRGPTGVM